MRVGIGPAVISKQTRPFVYGLRPCMQSVRRYWRHQLCLCQSGAGSSSCVAARPHALMFSRMSRIQWVDGSCSPPCARLVVSCQHHPLNPWPESMAKPWPKEALLGVPGVSKSAFFGTPTAFQCFQRPFWGCLGLKERVLFTRGW